jgi:hypothetical protein
VLAGRFGGRTVALVAAVTNPEWEPGRDEHEQYREHVPASLAASPWAWVIKASDFTDNAVGIIHLTGPKLAKLAHKYAPLVPALRELILRPGTPLDAGVKDMIAAQFDATRERFAAIMLPIGQPRQPRQPARMHPPGGAPRDRRRAMWPSRDRGSGSAGRHSRRRSGMWRWTRSPRLETARGGR